MALPAKSAWTFSATYAGCSDACASAELWALAAGLSNGLALRLTLVVEELFTNTIKYGYCRESKRPVKIELSVNDGLAQLEYRDKGPPFDSVRTMEICAEQNAPLRIGGVGLHLIQTISSNASYANIGGWNIVRLSVGDGPLPAAQLTPTRAAADRERH